MRVIFTLILLLTLASPSAAHAKGCGVVTYETDHWANAHIVVIKISSVVAIEVRTARIRFLFNGNKIDVVFKDVETAKKEFHKIVKRWTKCIGEG